MPEKYPTITIRDIRVVKVLLDEAHRHGKGAYRRTAAAVNASLGMVHESISRVEELLGIKLFEIEVLRKNTNPNVKLMERRTSKETMAGEQFRLSSFELLHSWDTLLDKVASAATYHPWLYPEERDY
jgi:hypothetical protein